MRYIFFGFFALAFEDFPNATGLGHGIPHYDFERFEHDALVMRKSKHPAISSFLLKKKNFLISDQGLK
jgi:hypothetical protein